MKEKKRQLVSMVNYIAETYEELRHTNKRMKKYLFDDIVNDAKRNFGATCDTISMKTIQPRFQQNNMIINHRGTKFPMSYLEPALLEIVIQRGKINQPLTVTEELQLENSIVKVGSVKEGKVISYLKAKNQYSTVGSSTKNPWEPVRD